MCIESYIYICHRNHRRIQNHIHHVLQCWYRMHNRHHVLSPARPGHRGDTRGGKPQPPTVPYVWHSGTVEVTEKEAPAHRAVKEGIREESVSLCGGVGVGFHLQGIQRLWASPIDGDLLPIPEAGDIVSRQLLAGVGQ